MDDGGRTVDDTFFFLLKFFSSSRLELHGEGEEHWPELGTSLVAGEPGCAAV